MFKYKGFWRLYAQSMVLSIPQIVTGYLCVEYLEFPLLDYQSFYLGLACSYLLTPLMVNVTRFRLMFINAIMLSVGIIGLSTEDYSTNLGYKIFTAIIGVIVGCDWLMTIKFIREQAGWEEKRSIYINNNPFVFFFLGSMIRISYIRKQNTEDEQIIVSILIIFANMIRLLSLLTVFGKQSLEFYYRKFKELQGRVIIKDLFHGDTKEIEYFYISNNEANSKLNLNTMALFSQNYYKRFFCCVVLALFSWLQLNNHIYLPNPNDVFIHPYRYFIPAILTLTTITPIMYKHFHIRNVMIFLNVFMLILSVLQLMKERVNWMRETEIILYFAMLLIFIAYFIGLNMLITQQLPYKGITYCLNLTFVSLLIAQKLEQIIMENGKKGEIGYLRYVYVITNMLSLPVLLKMKSIRQFRECEIQQMYA